MILMYIPHAFRVDDCETLHGLMQRYSFATLVTGGSEPFATHLPLLLDASRGPHGTLFGHFAGPNLHWQCDHQRLVSKRIEEVTEQFVFLARCLRIE
jgi:predicted FMN-binding regulatory protein PaiB